MIIILKYFASGLYSDWFNNLRAKKSSNSKYILWKSVKIHRRSIVNKKIKNGYI